MRALLTGIDRFVALCGRLAAVALVALFALLLTEIFLRSVVGYSLPFVVEYTGYLVALSFLWGAGWTLMTGGHVRVSVLTGLLSAAARRRLDLVVSALVLILALLLLFAWGHWTLGSYVRGSLSYFPTATPLAIPQALLALGPLGLSLAALARLIRLFRGEAAEFPADQVELGP